ncbi:unnamed protein product [Echinostoma caproni]|uniref:FBD domain-containing protein n=1 Tax=Echinostoma caproni TaxID=27848 RepID=A0A183BBI6_9TREM|nr:unnamed protein product [Echinostoma caproni]
MVMMKVVPLGAGVQFIGSYALRTGSNVQDLEWKLVYVSSAYNASLDQTLDSILVGPVPVGRHQFLFELIHFLITSSPKGKLVFDFFIVMANPKVLLHGSNNEFFYRQFGKNKMSKIFPLVELKRSQSLESSVSYYVLRMLTKVKSRVHFVDEIECIRQATASKVERRLQ